MENKNKNARQRNQWKHDQKNKQNNTKKKKRCGVKKQNNTKHKKIYIYLHATRFAGLCRDVPVAGRDVVRLEQLREPARLVAGELRGARDPRVKVGRVGQRAVADPQHHIVVVAGEMVR
jgi:hypothetical protein